MNLKEYQEFCKTTAKKFDSRELEILTWGLGITGEAGDVASCIKKTFAHKNDVSPGIRENLGDTLWYIAMICNFFDWDLDKILEENMGKLRARFPQGFTYDSVARKMVDWTEEKEVKNG